MDIPPPLPTTPPPLPGFSKNISEEINQTDRFDGSLIDQEIDSLQKVDETESKIITLMPIETNIINLQKNEFCYFEFQVKQIEDMKVTDRVNYRGPVLRVKILPGLSYRLGSAKIKTESHTDRKTTDEGLLFITSKRVFFDGGQVNKTFLYKDIVKYFGYENGFEFEKESGKKVFYEINKHERKKIEMACRVIEKFLSE